MDNVRTAGLAKHFLHVIGEANGGRRARKPNLHLDLECDAAQLPAAMLGEETRPGVCLASAPLMEAVEAE